MELVGLPAFNETTALAGPDLLGIFNEVQDYICVHRVELDEFGDVVDARLRVWNRAYESCRTKPVEVDQSMRDTYHRPELALDFVNRAWRDGVARQIFGLSPATRDVYRPDGAVVLIDVLWQRIGDYVVEVGNDMSELRMLQLQLADHESAATAALRASIVAEERERIAQDLHDSVIQQLFASALQLNTLADVVPEYSAGVSIRLVAETLSNVMSEIRQVIVEIRKQAPSSLEMELSDAVVAIASAVGVHCSVKVVDDATCVGEIRSNLRIAVREAVTNAVRHANADKIEVVVRRAGHHIVVTVADDGNGGVVSIDGSSGLANLRRRAEQLGGSMTVELGKAAGTVVTWRVPLPVGQEG